MAHRQLKQGLMPGQMAVHRRTSVVVRHPLAQEIDAASMCIRLIEDMGQAMRRLPTSWVRRQRPFSESPRLLEAVKGVMGEGVMAEKIPVLAVSGCERCEIGKLLPLPIRTTAPGDE